MMSGGGRGSTNIDDLCSVAGSLEKEMWFDERPWLNLDRMSVSMLIWQVELYRSVVCV